MHDWLTFGLTIFFAALGSCGLFLSLLYFLQRRPATRKPESPASFFELEDLASRRRLHILGALYALPGAMLFLVIALDSKPLVESAKRFLDATIVDGMTDPARRDALKQFLMLIPDWLNPLFILVATLVLFAPYIRKPLSYLRSLFVFAMGIDTRANLLSLASAERALQVSKFEKIEITLAQTFQRSPPLAEELVPSSNRVKLAYQILYFSQDKTKNVGLTQAISETLKAIGVTIELREPSRPSYRHLLAAIVFYCVLCIAYTFFAPLAGPWLKNNSLVKALLQSIEWPEGPDKLALFVAQRTLAFIAPLAYGMHFYANTRNDDGRTGETWFQRFGVVFSGQFLLSFLINFIFIELMIEKRWIGEYREALISLGQPKILADIFTSSVAPGLALAAWIICSRLKDRWLAYIAVCLAAGMALGASQLAYEVISQNWRGYYVHEFVFGAFLTASYLCAALIARDIVSLAVEPGPVETVYRG
jgi:hypothetical protein